MHTFTDKETNNDTIPISSFPRRFQAFQDLLTAQRIKRGALLYWAALFMISAASIHGVGLLKQPPQSMLLIALLAALTMVQAAVAILVVAAPARRPLIIAAMIEVAATALWFISHNLGLPDGFTIWRPETLNMPDLYLPVMEGASAFFFLCLFGRTWSDAPRGWRITLKLLPSLVMLALIVWAAIHYAIAELVIALFILDAGLPTSFQLLFLPAVGLLLLLLLLRLIFRRLRTSTPHTVRSTLILLPALLIVSIMTWTGCMNATYSAWFSATAAVHAPAGQTTTLAYCNSADGKPLAMDLTEPSAQAARPAPVVFFIHGGEALQGTRVLEDGSADGVYFTQLRDDLASHGFAVGSIDYGLAPLYKTSDEIKEAKCAVRFLRAHASELGVDPQRVGVYGPSMGGYISAMLGTVGPQVGYDVGQYLNQSSRVQAVVDMWGPTDLTDFSGSPSWVANLNKGLGTVSGSAARGLWLASPASHVAAGDPPFLIFHGAEDWFIAPHHSQKMAKLLHAAGVPETLVMIQNDGHGLDAPIAGKVEQPSPETVIHMISAFFVRTLGNQR